MTSAVFQLLQGVDLDALTAVQRLLLTTDGTLTDALEVALLEPMALLKISQRLVSATEMHGVLQLNKDDRVLERRIVLWGRRTGRHYVFAESMVAIDRLPEGFRHDLIESDVPLGRLWVKHRLETYKQLLSVDCDPAPRSFSSSRFPPQGC